MPSPFRPLSLPAVLLALAFLITTAQAAGYYDISRQEILIEVDEEGYGEITENYFISFPEAYFRDLFNQRTEELGSDLDAWQGFDEQFRIHIGGRDQILPAAESGKISFSGTSETAGRVQIRYQLKEPVMEMTEQQNRWTDFSLRKPLFNDFIVVAGTYSIPADTAILILLPAKVTVQDVDSRGQVIEPGNKVLWQGPTTGNEFKLRYRYWKNIAPPFSIASFMKELFETSDPLNLYLLAAVIAALLIVLYLLRRPLGERITAYVERNSVLGEA